MSFQKYGYLHVEKIIDTKKLFNITVKHSNNHPGVFDEQSPNSQAYYGEPVELKKLHVQLLPKLETLTGLKLFKTYFYWRMYYDGAILEPHTDRPACEISGTLFLGGDDWDIFIEDKNGNPIRVKQEAGDILLYKGCERKHWREPFKGKQHAQIFLHYVDQKGLNNWCKDDILKAKP